MTNAIAFESFSYAYPRTSTAALKEINLAIPQGSFTVVTGPTGAGKTTLCMAICGAAPQYFGGKLSGRVLVNGVSTLDVGMTALSEHVGTVMEDYESQLVTMTVEEEIAFGLENSGLPREEIRARVKTALALVGLEGLEKREIGALSGGQRQRLVLASILGARPRILVLDKPASALDPEGAESLYAFLGKLNRKHGITMVVIEPELDRVLAYADQYVLMSDGAVVSQGVPAEVLTYMYEHEAFRDGVPRLWELRMELQKQGFSLGEWLSETDALTELEAILAHLKGVCRSA